jgi:protocatechuate 3,4-dioxygenase beta subunit
MIRRRFIGLAASVPLVLAASKLAVPSDTTDGSISFDFPGDAPRFPLPSKDVGPLAVIAPESEPGERLIVTGTIYRSDGKTPAGGIFLHVYHTDAEGYYAKERGMLPRLQAWMKTAADGRYEFRTIKPAPYPSRTEAAHIHAHLTGPGVRPTWIESYLFAGDPFLRPADRESLAKDGVLSYVLAPEKGADGVLRARRDIRL